MKLAVLILSLFVSVGMNAQKGNLNLSKWHFSNEVKASDYQFINKVKLYCFLSNDYDNIYIDLKVEDAEVQERILKEGLTIWIDMDGKSAKQMGVRYPIGSQNPVGRKKLDYSENTNNPSGSIVASLSLANTIELVGFINEEVRHFPSENADNFGGSVKFDKEGILYYKLVMPIAKLPLRNSKQSNGAMPFALGIEYGLISPGNKSGNHMSPPPPSKSRSVGSRSGSAGGRSVRSESAPDNSSGTRSNSYQPVKKPVLNWIKGIKLATSK